MKNKNARKILSFVLALVLALPVISIPAVAAPVSGGTGTAGGTKAPAALFSQSFDELAIGATGKQLSSAVQGPKSATVVEGTEGRGNVLQIDCKAIGTEGIFHVNVNNSKNDWISLTHIEATSYFIPTTDPETGAPVYDAEGLPVGITKYNVKAEMQPIPAAPVYLVEGEANDDICAVQVTRVTIKDTGELVAYYDETTGKMVGLADIIWKGATQVNETDAEGNPIWLPVIDETTGEQVIGPLEDASGNKIQSPVMIDVFDEDGNPVMEQKKDELGKPVYDENGDPVMVQKQEQKKELVFEYEYDEDGNILLDENGEKVLKLDENGDPIPVMDVVPGEYEKDENGKYIFVMVDGKWQRVPKKVQRTVLVYEYVIGPLERPLKKTINDAGKGVISSLYITTDALRDAYAGNINNIATPALVQSPALKSDSNILIFSADYYFSADDPDTPDVNEALSRGMDIRVSAMLADGKTKKTLDFMSIANPDRTNGTITLKAHESDAKTQLIGGTKTINLGTWVNILIAADLNSGTILIYVDGELMCVRQDAELNADGTFGKSGWDGPCASIAAKTWNLGHFTRGGKVSDYQGYLQIDNVAIYDGSKLREVFAYLGFDNEVEEDYEAYDVGTILDTYYNGSSPIASVAEIDGNKAANIDLTLAGNIDANFKPNIDAVTYLDTDTVVLEADYYLTSDAVSKIQSQIYQIGAHIDVENSPFAYPMQANKTYTWIDLYTINAEAGKSTATVTCYGSTDATQSVTIDKGRWNTFSTVISTKDGSYTLYINGIAAIEGRLGKLISGVNYNFKEVSFSQDQWIAAKIMKGNLARQGNLYLDDLMVTELGGEKAKLIMVEAMLSAEVWANGEYYTTVYTNNRFYQSSDIEIRAEIFDLEEQLGNATPLVMEGASIRFTNPAGIRFASKLDVEALDRLYDMVGDESEGAINLQSVSFGTLIVPTDYLNGKEITFENLDEMGVTYANIEGTRGYYYDLDGDGVESHVAGSLVNLKEENIDRLFSGVNYIRIVLPNGIVYNIYSDRSWCTSAQSVADDAYGEYSVAEQTLIDSFLAGAKPDSDFIPIPPSAGEYEGYEFDDVAYSIPAKFESTVSDLFNFHTLYLADGFLHVGIATRNAPLGTYGDHASMSEESLKSFIDELDSVDAQCISRELVEVNDFVFTRVDYKENGKNGEILYYSDLFVDIGDESYYAQFTFVNYVDEQLIANFLSSFCVK